MGAEDANVSFTSWAHHIKGEKRIGTARPPAGTFGEGKSRGGQREFVLEGQETG